MNKKELKELLNILADSGYVWVDEDVEPFSGLYRVVVDSEIYVSKRKADKIRKVLGY